MAASLERRLVNALRTAGASLVAIESCTGGGIADAITGVPGSSDVFWGSLVTYRESAKRGVLGLPAALLRGKGAVSQEVARAMCVAGLKKARGEGSVLIAVSTTGVAGPGGGSARTPVGLCFIGVATAGRGVRVVRVPPSSRKLSRIGQKRRFIRAALEEALREAREL